MYEFEKILVDLEYQQIKLKDLVMFREGEKLKKDQLKENGGFPVFGNTNKPYGYSDISNMPGGSVFVVRYGSAGAVGYSPDPYWLCDKNSCLVVPTWCCTRYIFHSLNAHKGDLLGKRIMAGVPLLPKQALENFTVNIPNAMDKSKSFSAQRMISSILDLFLEVSDLSKREASLRDQQFAYYCCKLLGD